MLRAELKRREAKEAAGEFVPRLPYVERWFSKDYHGPAAERLVQPSQVESKLPPMKMAWEA